MPVRCLSAIGLSQTGSPHRTPRTSGGRQSGPSGVLLEVQWADPALGTSQEQQQQNGCGGGGLSSVSALVSSRKNVPLASSLSLFLPTETFACLVSSSLTALADNG